MDESLPPLSKELLDHLRESSSSDSRGSEGADLWVDLNEKKRRKQEREEHERVKESERLGLDPRMRPTSEPPPA